MRKRLLVVKSAIDRKALSVEIHNLQATTAWIGLTARCVRAAAPLVVGAVSVSTLFGFRKGSLLRRVGRNGARAWSLFKGAKTLMRALREV